MAEPLVVDGADRRVAVLYALAAGGGSAAAALFSDPRAFGPWPWWWSAASGAALAGLSVITPLRRKVKAAACVRAACWAAAGGWVADGCLFGLGRSGYWLTLVVGTTVLGMAASIWAMPTDFGLPMQPGPAAAQAQPAAPHEWADLIARVTKGKIKGVTGIDVRPWDTGTGYTVHGTMPPDGSTWETLAPFEAGLAASLRLPAGGGVTVGPDLDGDAASFRVDVLEQDALAGSMTYPGLDDEGGW